jgi:hypothetical protein
LLTGQQELKQEFCKKKRGLRYRENWEMKAWMIYNRNINRRVGKTWFISPKLKIRSSLLTLSLLNFVAGSHSMFIHI